MTGEDIQSARRLILGAVLVYLLWLLAGQVISFAEQVKRQDREQKQTLEMLERNRQRELAIIQQQHESIYRQAAQTAMTTQATPPDGSRHSGQKMPAPAVVKRLRQVNAFGLVASRERLLHCTDNHGGWDYTCVFHGDPISSSNWVQFGVLVDKAHIIEMSETYPSGAAIPAPLSAATR
jgi:hypothetical protein